MPYELVVFLVLCVAAPIGWKAHAVLVSARGVPRQAALYRALILDRANLSPGGHPLRLLFAAFLPLTYLVLFHALDRWGGRGKWSDRFLQCGGYLIFLGWMWLLVLVMREAKKELDALGLSYSQGSGTAESWGRTIGIDQIYEGVRHGRAVRIDLFAGGGSLVRLRPLVPIPPFELVGAHRMVLAADNGKPACTVLAALPESAQWEGAFVRATASGIEVWRQKPGRGSRFWLYDLWLAERLAHAYDEAGTA